MLAWYRSIPLWFRDYVAGWLLAIVASGFIAKGLWAQAGAASADTGLAGFIERNWVVFATVLTTAAVGLNRLARLERDVREFRDDVSARRVAIDQRFDRVGDEYLSIERFEGFAALAREQHMQILNGLDKLHQSIKEIRANQSARTRRGTAEGNP